MASTATRDVSGEPINPAGTQLKLGRNTNDRPVDLPAPDASIERRNQSLYPVNMQPLVVVTRLGIGVSRAEFYEYRLSLLSHSLARSIAAQTEKENLHWVIALDIRAPKEMEVRIRDAIYPARARFWRRNPYNTGLDPVDRDDIAGMFGGLNVIVARVDDDDLIHRDFAKKARDALAERQGLSALSFDVGFDLSLSDLTPAVTSYPWIAAGLCIKSAADSVVTPYDFHHLKIPQRIKKRGGNAHVISDSPMWVRVWHSASDSAEARGIRSAQGAAGVDWTEYGVNEGDLRELQQIAASVPPQPSKRHSFSRLEMKGAVVNQIRHLKLQAETAPEAQAKRAKKDARRLLEVLYSF